jgi:hypothetical protein
MSLTKFVVAMLAAVPIATAYLTQDMQVTQSSYNHNNCTKPKPPLTDGVFDTSNRCEAFAHTDYN